MMAERPNRDNGAEGGTKGTPFNAPRAPAEKLEALRASLAADAAEKEKSGIAGASDAEHSGTGDEKIKEAAEPKRRASSAGLTPEQKRLQRLRALALVGQPKTAAPGGYQFGEKSTIIEEAQAENKKRDGRDEKGETTSRGFLSPDLPQDRASLQEQVGQALREFFQDIKQRADREGVFAYNQELKDKLDRLEDQAAILGVPQERIDAFRRQIAAELGFNYGELDRRFFEKEEEEAIGERMVAQENFRERFSRLLERAYQKAVKQGGRIPAGSALMAALFSEAKDAGLSEEEIDEIVETKQQETGYDAFLRGKKEELAEVKRDEPNLNLTEAERKIFDEIKAGGRPIREQLQEVLVGAIQTARSKAGTDSFFDPTISPHVLALRKFAETVAKMQPAMVQQIIDAALAEQGFNYEELLKTPAKKTKRERKAEAIGKLTQDEIDERVKRSSERERANEESVKLGRVPDADEARRAAERERLPRDTPPGSPAAPEPAPTPEPAASPVVPEPVSPAPASETPEIVMPREPEDFIEPAPVTPETPPGAPSPGFPAAPEPAPTPEPAPVPAPEARPRSEEELKINLEQAKNRLVEVENHPEKFTNHDQVLREATAGYERARAEYVCGDIRKFVAAQTELLQKRAEISGTFERGRKTWKWLGEQNMSKRWNPDSRFLQFGSRMLSVRTGISGVLLCLAVFTPTPIGAVALGVRRAMAGAGAAFGTYELVRRRYEAKLHLTNEEVQALAPQEVEERMLHLAAFAKVTGSWQAIEKTYGELRSKYEENLTREAGRGRLDLSDYQQGEVARTREREMEHVGEEKMKEQRRRVGSVAVGIAAALGLPAIRNWLGYKDIAEAAAAAPRAALPVETGAPSPLAPVRPAPSEWSDIGTRQEYASGAQAPLPVETREALKEIGLTFKSGEGPLHQARKALSLYIDRSPDSALKSLDPARRIWAEERLWKLTSAELEKAGALKKVYQPGDALAFKQETVKKVLDELREKYGTAERLATLRANLKDYIGRVNWERYKVVGGRGGWEADDGVSVRIPKKVIADAVKSGGDVPPSAVSEVSMCVMPGDADISVCEAGEQIEIRVQGLLDDTSKGGYRDIITSEHGGSPAPMETGEGAEAVVVDVAGAEQQGVDVTDIDTGKESRIADEALKLARAKELLNRLVEGFVKNRTGLEKPYFNLVKDLEVGEMIKKKFFPFRAEEQWPWPKDINPNHRDTARYIKLRDMIRAGLSVLTPDAQKAAAKTSVGEFLGKYYIAQE